MIRIGTRGSQLALWQTNFIANALRERGAEVSIAIIRTTGDARRDVPLPTIGGKGLFTAEIEAALLDDSIDLAVHSLKDLPTQIATEFCIAAVPARADARDVLLAREQVSIAGLPAAAVVGTSSPRRQGQLLALRHDLRMQSLRGNVDTRIRKLRAGETDAIVLAAAGVQRLGLTELVSEYIAPEHVCPCPGQGALAVETRAADQGTRDAVAFLEDAATRRCVDVERGVLARLGGGCSIPVGVYCEPHGEGHRCWASVCSLDGADVIRIEHTGREDQEDLMLNLADRLLAEGAAQILAAGGD